MVNIVGTLSMTSDNPDGLFSAPNGTLTAKSVSS